ncbi:MAG TPA: peptidoglycan-associated lipoprotein Pal [Polyangia bacterium]|jgi:peptidoglycan-associated lipoprotein|nr:peptidoglycan-associated lipoprotein Pal [Polyangia bacterium]
MRTLAIAALPFVALLGCAHKQETKAQATPPAPPPPAVAQSQPAAPTGTCARDLDCPSGQICIDGRCSDISSNLSACTSVRVHFAFNSSDIDTADRDGLERAARCMKADSALHIAVAGNADERGTEEYNMALGDRRAHSVQDYLRSLGASEAQMQTVSYGKERPLCSDHDEACWQQNRRADLAANTATGKAKKHHK